MDQRGGISLIYSSLACKENIPPYARAWEMDTGHSWDQNVWSQVFQHSYKGILNISLIEANVKLLTRWHYIPSRLAMIYPEASSLCFRGCKLEGTIFHIWWTCPRISSYWDKVFFTLRKLTDITISQDSHHSPLKLQNPDGLQTHASSVFFHPPGS